MVIKIRLARFGRRHAPFYNIVVAHARTARNSKPLEVIGTYDPIPRVPPPAGEPFDASKFKSDSTPDADLSSQLAQTEAAQPARKQKDIRLDVSRARYWLGVGAQPSDPAWRLLSMIGLVEPKWRVGASYSKPVGGLLETTRREQAKPRVQSEKPSTPAMREGGGEGETLKA